MSDRQPGICTTEGALVGGLLLAPDRMDDVPAELAPSDFAHRELGQLFAAMVKRHRAGLPLDPASISADLNPDLADVLVECMTAAATAANVEHHAHAILAAGVRRQLEVGLAAIARGAADAGQHPRDVMAEVAALTEAADGRLHGATSDAGVATADGMAAVLARAEAAARGELAGIRTGFASIDTATGGMRPGGTWILGARPSMGKTTLAAQLAATAAAGGHRTAIVSLEMPAADIWARLVSSRTSINGIRLREGSLAPEDWTRLTTAAAELSNRLGDLLTIYDRTGSSIDAIIASLRRANRQRRLELVVVDFIQRIHPGRESGRAGNRNAELEVISRRLADFAREAGVSILVCSQLSRGAEGVRPNLGHLRDCGSLEADADVVIFLHRPEDGFASDRELILAKCRDGKTGATTVRLDPDRMLFRAISGNNG